MREACSCMRCASSARTATQQKHAAVCSTAQWRLKRRQHQARRCSLSSSSIIIIIAAPPRRSHCALWTHSAREAVRALCARAHLSLLAMELSRSVLRKSEFWKASSASATALSAFCAPLLGRRGLSGMGMSIDSKPNAHASCLPARRRLCVMQGGCS